MILSRLRLPGAVCALVLYAAAGGVECAQVVKGTLVSPPAEAGFIRVEIEGNTTAIRPSEGAKIMRGQIGKDIRKVSLQEFAPGDHIVAVVNQRGRATSLKAFYGRVQGTLAKLEGRTLVLQDERTVTLSASPQVVFPDGSIGKPGDLRPGMLVICRVNPLTHEAWTVVSVAATGTAVAEPASNKPEIRSVTYSAPSPLKAGDLITVDLAGTRGGKATFEVKNLIGAANMKEVSPGSYRAVAEVPSGKSVLNAPLIGRLSAGGLQAAPVQASRLVTVTQTTIEPVLDNGSPTGAPTASAQPATSAANPPVPRPEPIAARARPPAADTPETAAEPPEVVPVEVVIPAVAVPVRSATSEDDGLPRPAGKVVLTCPPDGAKIQKALLVRGIADPDSKVRVTITYTNALAGILKLSGLAASQDLAVGKNGEFRMGPLPLEGPLATKGLHFTIKAYYPDREEHATAVVRVIGERS